MHEWELYLSGINFLDSYTYLSLTSLTKWSSSLFSIHTSFVLIIFEIASKGVLRLASCSLSNLLLSVTMQVPETRVHNYCFQSANVLQLKIKENQRSIATTWCVITFTNALDAIVRIVWCLIGHGGSDKYIRTGGKMEAETIHLGAKVCLLDFSCLLLNIISTIIHFYWPLFCIFTLRRFTTWTWLKILICYHHDLRFSSILIFHSLMCYFTVLHQLFSWNKYHWSTMFMHEIINFFILSTLFLQSHLKIDKGRCNLSE